MTTTVAIFKPARRTCRCTSTPCLLQTTSAREALVRAGAEARSTLVITIEALILKLVLGRIPVHDAGTGRVSRRVDTDVGAQSRHIFGGCKARARLSCSATLNRIVRTRNALLVPRARARLAAAVAVIADGAIGKVSCWAAVHAQAVVQQLSGSAFRTGGQAGARRAPSRARCAHRISIRTARLRNKFVGTARARARGAHRVLVCRASSRRKLVRVA